MVEDDGDGQWRIKAVHGPDQQQYPITSIVQLDQNHPVLTVTFHNDKPVDAEKGLNPDEKIRIK